MSILVLLKDNTRPQHDRLETELNLLRPDLSIDDYIGLLKKFYGFYLPLEKTGIIPVDRLKVPHLEKDLRFFRIEPDLIKTCLTLPDVSTPSHIYGVRYVIEGSTLGGMVLTKHFKEIFHVFPDSGCFFFSGYGSETMPMWKAFQSELLEFSKTENFNEEIVLQSARDTFESLRLWLLSER